MKSLIPVKNNAFLGRDPKSKAIVNTDLKGYAEAKARKEALNRKKEKENEVYNRLDKLEDGFEQISNLLNKILEKLS